MQAVATRNASGIHLPYVAHDINRRRTWNGGQNDNIAPPPVVIETNNATLPHSPTRFMRRSTWNAEQINATLEAPIFVPPVVDITTYAVPKLVRASPLPFVDVTTCGAPSPTGRHDKFVRRSSWIGDLSAAAVAC